MIVDNTIIVLFLIANLYIGYLSSKKVINFSHFSVGHRGFSSILIFCTLSATFIGGGYTIGNAGKVFSSGLIYSFALLGFSLKEVLVACFVAPRMGRFNDCHSIGDIMVKQYGMKVKVITGLLSLLICGGILGAQVGALAAIFDTTLPISPTVGVVIAFAILLVYSSLGGMRAVVFTDTLQFCILAIGIPLTFFIGLYHIGGWHKVTAIVPNHYIDFLYSPARWGVFALLFVTFIFGETLVPPYVQRLFMAKDVRSTFKGTLASGLVSIPIFLLCGGIGLIAYAYNQHMNPNNAFTAVASHLLPVGVRGLVIAALLSIILSSAAGFLNAASISFVNDIVKPLKKHDERLNYLRLARLSTIIVGVIAVIFAFSVKGVLDILLTAYNFWSPIMLVPLLAVIFKVNASAKDFFVGAALGIAGELVWQYVLHSPQGIPPLLFGLLCNFMAFNLSRKCFAQKTY